jgi:glycosyltransferase involved in cell wall biosynthesis
MAYSDQIGFSKRTRILFLAWGYSIHAKRRIQVFIDDPRFEVMVVSTFNYDFENAKNVLLLSGDGERRKRANRDFLNSRVNLKRPGWNFRRDIKASITGMMEKVPSVCRSFSFLEIACNNLLRMVKSVLGLRLMIQDLRLLKLTVKEFCPDVIFLQTLLYPSYLSYFLPRSIPIIITFWNGDVIWWAKWNGVERYLKKQIVVYGVKRSSLITVNSEKAFQACLQYGANHEKIKIIRYPGVDLNRFKPIPQNEAKQRIGIKQQKVVFCPRGIGGHLNSKTIIGAAPAVIESCPETVFIFAGVMVEKDLIEHREQALKSGIERNILWKGMIPWEEMPIYYSCSDVMISISSKDSLPNCMLEAMACHIPVIMGDIPQIREWIQDEVNGFLVPPHNPGILADRILRVLKGTDSNIDQFNKRNQIIVAREMDSRTNNEMVRNLVHQLVSDKCLKESI